MIEQDVDVLIVGGGLTGAMLLLALQPLGLRCLLVDNQALSHRLHHDFDARSFALSAASISILETLGLWSLLATHATSIHTVHVSEKHRFGNVLLQGEEGEALGAVVESHHLSHAIYQRLDPKELMIPATVVAFEVNQRVATLQTETATKLIRARLVVAADGADSCIRSFCQLRADEKNYQQHAVLANIGLARHHHNIAYERFTRRGPMALLPMSDSRMALVWCVAPDEAKRLSNISEPDFLRALQQQFGYRSGRFLKVGRRSVYPLRQVTMRQCVTEQVVFIGNAAHTLHPVAGQGFNLGLRDVAMLAECIVKHGISAEMLKVYKAARKQDHAVITRFTGGLIDLFSHQRLDWALARSVGMVALDNNMRLKKVLSRYARGYAGIVPDLVCGIPLKR